MCLYLSPTPGNTKATAIRIIFVYKYFVLEILKFSSGFFNTKVCHYRMSNNIHKELASEDKMEERGTLIYERLSCVPQAVVGEALAGRLPS